MAIPPIIPAPKSNAGQAAQRASQQQKTVAGAYRGPAPVAPALPPILPAHAPPASSYRSQQAAAAYRPPPNAKYSSAGLPPAPSRSAGQSSTAPSSGVSKLVQKQVVTGQIIAAWFALRSKGLFPATAVPPIIKFDTHETPGVGAYVTRVGGSGPREFHVPPSLQGMLTSPTNPHLSAWARTAILHELAHTAQNYAAGQSKGMREGGADAFAQDTTDAVYGTPPTGSIGRHAGYVDQFRREPYDWTTHNQFVPSDAAPMINMPGAPSFRVAMRGVGDSAGIAAENTAARTDYLASPRNLPLGPGAKRLAVKLMGTGWQPNLVTAKVSRRKGSY